MAEKIVKLDAGGGLPECQITIGQGQYGKYQTFIWDTTGHDPKDVMAGTNDDTIADKFPIRESKSPTIKKVGDLDKRVFSWEIIVAAFASAPGQLYSVTVSLTQDGNDVPGGTFTQSGSLDGTELVYDHVRFLVI